jgi:hypothetical protein
MRSFGHAGRLVTVIAPAIVWAATSRLVLAATFLARTPAVTREFRIDSSHSRVGFSISFLGSHVRGQFDDIQGMLSFDPEFSNRSGATVTIATASLHTGSAHRDEHLRSSDFFDVERFPRRSHGAGPRVVRRVGATHLEPNASHAARKRSGERSVGLEQLLHSEHRHSRPPRGLAPPRSAPSPGVPCTG